MRWLIQADFFKLVLSFSPMHVHLLGILGSTTGLATGPGTCGMQPWVRRPILCTPTGFDPVVSRCQPLDPFGHYDELRLRSRRFTMLHLAGASVVIRLAVRLVALDFGFVDRMAGNVSDRTRRQLIRNLFIASYHGSS